MDLIDRCQMTKKFWFLFELLSGRCLPRYDRSLKLAAVLAVTRKNGCVQPARGEVLAPSEGWLGMAHQGSVTRFQKNHSDADAVVWLRSVRVEDKRPHIHVCIGLLLLHCCCSSDSEDERLCTEIGPTTGEIMHRRVITVRPEQSVEECMALMTERRVRHLPVVEGDKNKSSLATHRGRKGVGVGVPWPAKLVLFPIAPPDNHAHSRHSRNSERSEKGNGRGRKVCILLWRWKGRRLRRDAQSLGRQGR